MKNLIDARKLKAILSNKTDFSEWMKRTVRSNNFTEKIDFFAEKEKVELLKNGKGTKINYYLTKESAIKIIMKSSRNKMAINIKKQLEKGKDLNEILNQLEKEKNSQIKVINIEDKEYPEQLRKIKNPPNQLYVKGSTEILKEYAIAIIGSRYCSEYGRRIARNFSMNLVGYNLNIISGLAAGIDSCAHRACIEAKGKTIAVLPSGFNKVYPKQNEDLLNKIVEEDGAVVTEYPPEFEKTQESCRQRNRIMSALSIGVLVIEAGARSGTSITVRYANEQNKKVFCIPSSLLNSKGIGTNEMIKENRAKLVTEVEDIIKEFPELKLEKKAHFILNKIKDSKEAKKIKTKKEIKEVPEEFIGIYKILEEGPKQIDEIARRTKEAINEVTYKLTLLELQGIVEETAGKTFKIK